MDQCSEEITNELIQKFSLIYENDSKRISLEFSDWSEQAQNDFFNHALSRLSHKNLKLFDQILNPLLQKDIVGTLSDVNLSHISSKILCFLDAQSLFSASCVSKKWNDIIYHHQIWKKLIDDNLRKKTVWRELLKTSNYEYLFNDNTIDYKTLSKDIYEKIYYKLDILENVIQKNWEEGKYNLKRICCENDINRGVYCIQYDDEKIICGLRDNTIKIWNIKTHELLRTLRGHEGSVLCLQYKDRYLISGSSDSTIRVWNHETTQEYEKIESHKEPVLHLKFNDLYLITCSKDYTISIFKFEKFQTIPKLSLFTTLREHKAAVNVIDFDNRFLVSASGDRTIKVWEIGRFNCIHTLTGHRRGIACLQFFANLIISGSSDHTIRVWDINIGSCIRILFGHEELVRCIRFDTNFIISGAYDGKIKVWKLNEVIDKNIPHVALKATTLCEHTSRVFKLQFDAFKIVSSSQDDTILIWDFLGLSPEELERFWNLKFSTTPPCLPKAQSHLNLSLAIGSDNNSNHRTNNSHQPVPKALKTSIITHHPSRVNKNNQQGQLTVNNMVVDQRETHPISRMLRKCLSLKKTKKDQLLSAAMVDNNSDDATTSPSTNTVILATTSGHVVELPSPNINYNPKQNDNNHPRPDKSEVFVNNDSKDMKTPDMLITHRLMKRSLLMETDSPMKEASSSSSNHEEDEEDDENLIIQSQHHITGLSNSRQDIHHVNDEEEDVDNDHDDDDNGDDHVEEDHTV